MLHIAQRQHQIEKKMFLLKQLLFIVIGYSSVLGLESHEPKAIEWILREDVVNYRLPNHTHPESYDLAMLTRVDLADFEFTGLMKIRVMVDHTTREIVLHARDLTIKSVRLARFSGTVPVDIRLQPHSYDDDTEFLTITTDGITLTPGDRLLLEIVYTGALRTDGVGFYRASYIDSSGNET